ncbi:YslB family protein [Ligilactobacillus sp. WILCCON 0076]|uniref:YslB family protein n=1 Tax=Ligilactobacillus ubinensis TaxID=2876789 RepID=A0A9X2FGI3_9LACO|nr:YslB family protein [Ligilactobacillus ubinensis]MCP0885982.1 YslB family protein [Ligilactobacillus ubinensis]
MNDNFYDLSLADKTKISTFGLTVLRDSLLPQLTDGDNNILYWAGKKLARQFFVANEADLPLFFEQAGWGLLTHKKNKGNQQIFTLSGPIIATRLKLSKEADFKLECGFLAETIQNQTKVLSEAFLDNANERKGVVTLIVQFDTKDYVNPDLYKQLTPLEILHADTISEEN